MKTRRAFLSLEYAFMVVVVVAALVGMSVYLKRAILGRWRDAGDSFGQGRQYSVSGSSGNHCSGTPILACSDFSEEGISWGCQSQQSGGGCNTSAPAGCYMYPDNEECCFASGEHCNPQVAGCHCYEHYTCEGSFSCGDAQFQSNPSLCRSVGCQWTD